MSVSGDPLDLLKTLLTSSNVTIFRMLRQMHQLCFVDTTYVGERTILVGLQVEISTRINFNQFFRLILILLLNIIKEKTICWDVVNEAIADNPNPSDPLKHNVWYPTLTNYIDVAFQAARNADSTVKLFYNDYGAEGLGGKSDAVYNLVKGMKSRGIPIDGVGLQMHVATSYYPSYSQIVSNIQRLGALGLQVHITEMDVKCPDPCNKNLQAQVYSDVLHACLTNSNICKSFQSWGFTDKYTWLGQNQHPLPFDENYAKKPAYQAILNNFTAFASFIEDEEYDE